MLILEDINMLRYTTIISTCLLLLGISCSRAKQAQQCSGGTDPHTGACLAPGDPNTSQVATLQAQLDAQSRQIQEFLRQNREKQAELMRLRAELADANTPQSRKDAILKKLEEAGMLEAGVQIGVAAVTRLLDKYLPPATHATPPTEAGTQQGGYQGGQQGGQGQ